MKMVKTKESSPFNAGFLEKAPKSEMIIEQKIIHFLQGSDVAAWSDKKGFVSGGVIEDYIRDRYKNKGSSVSRKCREMACKGLLDRKYKRVFADVNPLVFYRINKQHEKSIKKNFLSKMWQKVRRKFRGK